MPCSLCRESGHNARTCVLKQVTQKTPQVCMLTNEILLTKYATHKQAKREAAVCRLRETHPFLAGASDDEILAVYDTCVSIHQSKNGTFLESTLETILREMNIPFEAQVHINEDGYIVERTGKKKKGITIPDIVFGTPVVGTHISAYKVLSLKTSSRERSKLDTAWTLKHPPLVFYYGTLENDYPDPDVFGTSASRKLVCASPRDGRVLRFEDLVPDLA